MIGLKLRRYWVTARRGFIILILAIGKLCSFSIVRQLQKIGPVLVCVELIIKLEMLFLSNYKVSTFTDFSRVFH
jgi:hypothetical protein